MEDKLKKIEIGLIEGKGPAVRDLTRQAVEAGIAPKDILEQALMPGMNEVGRRMNEGVFFIPEVLIAARTMGMVLDYLKPQLMASDVKAAGTIVIGTVHGDLHDIGKNLVRMMYEGAGFTVIDLGVDVLPEKFVAAIREHNADILALSAMLTTTMGAMKDSIQAVQEAGLRDKIKIVIGGAPISQAYADEIGADGYSPDAGMAPILAKHLIA